MNLEQHGYIKMVNRVDEGIDRWCIVPKRVKYMLDGNRYNQSLLNEIEKSGYDATKDSVNSIPVR